MGLTTTDGGNVLVSDSMNGRVQVFNASRTPVRSIGGLGDRYGDMGRPRHVAVGPDDVVFVADAAFARVHVFNMEGQLLMLLGGEEDAPGATPMPVGVAVAPSLPDELAALVPADFDAAYYLFTTNSIGRKRISLYAVGLSR
jgi:DNA-binding beta-propeller fold protein YncE